MKKMLMILLLVMGMFIATGCTNNDAVYIEGLIVQGKLYVGTSTDYAPYEFVDLTKEGQERFVGSDIELAKAIAEEYNLELEIKVMGFEAILTALDTGKIDLAISGFTYSESRKANYLFSSSYYDEGEGDQILVMKKEDISKYPTLQSLNNENVKVAAQSGSIQKDLVDEQLPNCNKIYFESINDAFTALLSGQYDAIAMAKNPATSALTSQVNSSLAISDYKFETEDSNFYILAKKTSTELIEKVNVVCDKVSSGKYQEWVVNAQALYSNLGNNADELVPEDSEE